MRDDDLELLRGWLAGRGSDWGPQDVAVGLDRLGFVVSDAAVLSATDALRRTSVGAGPLEPLLNLPDVTDVLVNGADQVFIDRGRGLERTQVCFDSDDEVRRLATRLAASAGRRLDDAAPWVDARLPDGTRLHTVLACLAEPGTCISLRVPARRRMTLDQLTTDGSIDARIADVLQGLVANRAAYLVTGGTGTGKTTILGMLLGLVPDSERIVIVEDSRELNSTHDHVVRMECRPANAEGVGSVAMTDLVKQALRMRPDRLVVGEVRGPELCDLLTAMNTGHEGGCGTVHANSVTDVPARLEALAALGGMGREACHAQMASALDAVIHLRRGRDGRRGVAQIGVVSVNDDGRVSIAEALRGAPGAGSVPAPAWGELAALAGVTP
ncbi:TadA family conjugal transfer-associated ATPase [Propionibacterium freudenreichii]|uniref:TadA family conjugal transfer-associated ATPase n=1 Tax=Propionibacterium freudenreichii TaxID=1744 RepID=UPI000BC34222|nr:TadA family conjugal transfer-associated ATPase [Propionibacterium freudenreichii]MDK9591929.1 TadA family conjugal transfer-associated ATPase [Propionibacterium freudenreichii]WFF34865.1 TadA family conjugal transfer-associated ATPase [Propionibacterium freudenreichii]WFF37094.1 TadA family conjugal transfer-associated ATPase [Propionibacterium freudenreichii]SBN50038.1 Helicase/secretion neighborhood ATPase [Propionibacterium freudenreichii]